MDAPADYDVTDFLPYLLNQAAEAASRDFQKIYKSRYGMLRAEWRVLHHLGRMDGPTAMQISRACGMHKTEISRAVAKLEARRWVARRRSSVDRRQERLFLKDAGQTVYLELRAEAWRHDRAMAVQFGVDDLAQLRETLRDIIKGCE